MDNQLEFTAQAYSKMVMHAMKYPHSVCCGLLLSPKPSSQRRHNQHQVDENDENKSSLQNGSKQDSPGDDKIDADDEEPQARQTTKIIDAIPISHDSHHLATHAEVALHSVGNFALEQELVISGYYQTDSRCEEPGTLSAFGQRITMKIDESERSAVLCFIKFEDQAAKVQLDIHHLVDRKWQRRPVLSYKVENNPNVIAECILYSKEKLYRKIVDFDDYFNNFSLDWTNAIISQRIDHLVANIC